MQPLFLALLAALLFGASTPASKALLEDFTPLQLSGLLYLGAALGTAPFAWRERARRGRGSIDRRSLGRLAGAVILGGVVGPLLVLLALRMATSASVALLLNLELIATAVLGVLFFRESMGVRGWLGVASGFGAVLLLSMNGGFPQARAALLVAGACTAWGMDNHLTALIDGLSPAETTAWKGVVAGGTSLALGLALDPFHADWAHVSLALLVGVFSYGASIVLYVLSAQHLGATRAQVAFSSAPFLGAGLSYVLLREPLEGRQIAAACALALGIALLLRDKHSHEHTHEAVEHVHSHRHDDGHHEHVHPGLAPSTRHTHVHRHERLTHVHRHVSDLHHRHEH